MFLPPQHATPRPRLGLGGLASRHQGVYGRSKCKSNLAWPSSIFGQGGIPVVEQCAAHALDLNRILVWAQKEHKGTQKDAIQLCVIEATPSNEPIKENFCGAQRSASSSFGLGLKA